MERLTKTLINGAVLCNFGFINPEKCDRDCGRCHHGTRAFKKLAEYEDAEEQGLLIKQPCEPGTLVYCTNPDDDDYSGYLFIGLCKDYAIVTARYVHCDTFKEQLEEMSEDCGSWDGVEVWIFPRNKVFLTKEEAEAALKSREV